MMDNNQTVLYRMIIDTPNGEMIAMASAQGLCFLEFRQPGRNDLMEKRLAKYFKNYRIIDASTDILVKTGRWLAGYYAADFKNLETPPLDLRGTDFELTVWHALEDIPCGQTVSYGDIAQKIGKPNASRAVGNTNRKNPVPLIIPCHRVIGQDNSLTGYGGGLGIKKALLLHECGQKLQF